MADASEEDGWTRVTRGILRVEMYKRGLSYADLVLALAKVGVVENERNLRNKVARGTFAATFFVQCMVAMGVTEIPLEHALFREPDDMSPEVAEVRKPKGANWVRINPGEAE